MNVSECFCQILFFISFLLSFFLTTSFSQALCGMIFPFSLTGTNPEQHIMHYGSDIKTKHVWTMMSNEMSQDFLRSETGRFRFSSVWPESLPQKAKSKRQGTAPEQNSFQTVLKGKLSEKKTQGLRQKTHMLWRLQSAGCAAAWRLHLPDTSDSKAHCCTGSLPSGCTCCSTLLLHWHTPEEHRHL